MWRSWLIAAWIGVELLIPACAQSTPPPRSTASPPTDLRICDPARPWDQSFQASVVINGQTIDLEVARTPEEQAQGLMYRTQLPANQGMVFPFDPPQPTQFWMWQTCLNLDIIFVAQERVVHVAADVPPCRQQPCPVYGPPPQQLVDYVVEIQGGLASKLGLKVGDPLPVTFAQPSQ
ncbi:MAG: hypothetical protein OHK0012_21320 [Synechococcales cyanobacterium]